MEEEAHKSSSNSLESETMTLKYSVTEEDKPKLEGVKVKGKRPSKVG